MLLKFLKKLFKGPDCNYCGDSGIITNYKLVGYCHCDIGNKLFFSKMEYIEEAYKEWIEKEKSSLEKKYE